MPITASYSSTAFSLTVTGTTAAESIIVHRNPGGTLFVNGGAVPIAGGPATVANTDLIVASGGDGSDTIALDEANGALPDAELSGGIGNDVLNGGSGGDTLLGEGGNDILFGGGGIDLLDGGADSDNLNGGAGDDQLLGGAGNDVLSWTAGGGSDLMEGGDGIDRAEVIGEGSSETFTLTANGTRVRFDRLGANPFTLDIGTVENFVLATGAGNDSFSAIGNLAALISVRVEGGAGLDMLLGGNGADTLLGGDDNDFLDGNQGNDTLFGEGGDDVFQWDPGDGSDVIEGGAGTDTLNFNGSNAAESFTVLANGGRVVAGRDVASITLDLDNVETLQINTLGGADIVSVGDLAGTDATLVRISLASAIGGSSADGASDLVSVQGSLLDDVFTLTGTGGGTISATRLGRTVATTLLETLDRFEISTSNGNDTITTDESGGPVAAFTVFAGNGNDEVTGGAGNDILIGDPGDDTLRGRGGSDILTGSFDRDILIGGDGDDEMRGGDGDDVMIWNPGDDSDLMEGGADFDTAEVHGGGGGEVFTATANGTRVRFDRIDPAPFALDIGTTESLVLDAGAGDDSFSATGNLAALIAITVDGGDGNDTLLGSNGGDNLFGSDGNDFVDGNQGDDNIFLDAGDDVAQWDPGDGSDSIDGGAGLDALNFNASAAAEAIGVVANGGQARLTRNVGSITLDLDAMERLTLNLLGGADTLNIGNLAGAGVQQVIVNLAGTLGSGGGDSAVDAVTAEGRSGADTIVISSINGVGASVTGLAALLAINGVESSDQLTILAGGGNDTVTAALAPFFLTLTIDGGAGSDLLISNGEGRYLGGADNDVVRAGLTSVSEFIDGGEGVDTLDTTSFSGTYVVNLATGTTNFASETFLNFENLTTGAGIDTVTGTDAANVLRTNAGNDDITAGGGNDVIDGGTGADTMRGGIGDDRFFVDDAGDIVIELQNEGLDTVDSAVSFSLAGQFIEILRLTGGAAINGTGNSLTNILIGNANANILDGGAGADRMEGGKGEDVYVVDNAGDAAIELDGNGSDLVNASVTYSLAGQFIEVLNLTGGAAINGTGNGLANRLVGNGAANVLFGLSGNDRLDGGGGADRMNGGIGNDVYVVDNAADLVEELDGEGTDTVEAAIGYSLVGRFVELLVLTGTANIDGTGNGLANTIIGNSGANLIDGRGGADSMRGGAGDDRYIVDNVGDAVVELAGEGFDTVLSSVSFSLAGQFAEALELTGSAAINGSGNSLANVLAGNGAANLLRGEGGNDALHGGLGSDTLLGGAGADEFWFDTTPGASNVDTIGDFVVADDTILLDRTIFTGIAANGTLAAGAFRLGTAAVDADDRVLYDAATGNIRYDADGAGGAAAVIFARVTAGLALTAADFAGAP